MSHERYVEETGLAIQKLRQIQEFTTKPVHPDVVEFANFLAGRLGHERITPEGFAMVVTYSLYDLENGVDGFTGQPIKNNLVKRTPLAYGYLEANAPGIARIAFSEKFANAVNNFYNEVQKQSSQDTSKQISTTIEIPTDPDVIQDPIKDIFQAEQRIIGDAINRVITLDWRHFEITNLEDMKKKLEVIAPIILRNSRMNFSLNLLTTTDVRETAILLALPNNHKKQIVEDFWLAILAAEIDPEEATFTRDWLWLKGAEMMVQDAKLPLKQTLTHFSVTSPAYDKANYRAAISYAKRNSSV